MSKLHTNFCLAIDLNTNRKINPESVQEYLMRFKWLYTKQSSFRANNSIGACLSLLSDMILICVEKGTDKGMILIDFQQVFNTTNH